MNHMTVHTHALNIFYDALDRLIENRLLADRTVILFGSSRISLMIAAYLQKKGITVDYFIDNGKKLDHIHGIPVKHPADVLSVFLEDAAICIASAFQSEMIQQLEHMGYVYNRHIFKVVDLPALLQDYSFVERSGRSLMAEAEIRERQLSVLRAFADICDQNGIWYCLAYGTLLGAARHSGYIPWDDDIDIWVKNEEIERLYAAIEGNPAYSYIIGRKHKEYIEHIGLFVDHRSTVDLNRFPTQLTTGVSIDIFPLCGQPDDAGIEAYYAELCRLEETMYCSLHDGFAAHGSLMKLEAFLALRAFEDAEYVGDMLSPYHTKDRFPKEWFAKRVQMQFEDRMYYVPECAAQILQTLYGDFMQPPPVEKRTQRHFYRAYHPI